MGCYERAKPIYLGQANRRSIAQCLVEVHEDHVVINHLGTGETINLLSYKTSTVAIQNERRHVDEPHEIPKGPTELREGLSRDPAIMGRLMSAESYKENRQLIGYVNELKQNPEIF